MAGVLARPFTKSRYSDRVRCTLSGCSWISFSMKWRYSPFSTMADEAETWTIARLTPVPLPSNIRAPSRLRAT